MSFDEYSKELWPLEKFDPNVFISDSDVPENVCNFILALSVAYNDLRDIVFAHSLLSSVEIIPEKPKSTKLGFRNGLRNTIIRLQIGFVHEITKLIFENKNTLNESAFVALKKSLSKDGRRSWEAMVEASLNKPSDSPIAKAFVQVRNKIAFHYDVEEIGKSYRKTFLKNDKYGFPLVSRGTNIKSSRFYFSDALSQNYLLSITNDKEYSEFINGRGTMLTLIDRALFEIVTKFIESRSSWSRLK